MAYELTRRQRLVLGKNFIETLILTLTQMELFEGADLDFKLAVTRKLEEELCAMSHVSHMLKNTYHEALLNLISEEFPDLPKPKLRSCFASRELEQWIDAYTDKIFSAELGFETTETIEVKKKELLIRLLRTAIMSAFYATGSVSI